MSLFLGLLLLLASKPTPGASPTPPPDRTFDPAGLDLATLKTMAERGTVVVVDKDAAGKVKLVTAGIVIDKPPADVYAVATDYDHFAEFMPQTVSAKVVAQTDTTKDVEIKLKFKFSIITKTMSYLARHTYDPPRRITFEIVSGDISSGGGSYAFLPLEEGKKTLLFYSTISDLHSMGWATNMLIKEQPAMEPAIHVSTASIVVAAVKKRAEAGAEPASKN